MQVFKILWKPSLLLIILMMICLAFYHFAPPSLEGVRNFALNLGAGIVGTLLTVFLIDRVLKSKEELDEREKKRKYQEIAFRHLRIPLINHLRMFASILRAVSITEPSTSFESVRELFNKSYFAQLELLDFSKEAPLLGYKWSDYLVHECSRFKEALTRTLDRYSPYLDAEIVDLMEQIINSSFMDFVIAAPKTYELNLRMRLGVVPQWNLFTEKSMFGGAVNITKKYTERFSLLIEHYNQHVPENKIIRPDEHYWRNNAPPPYGSGRFEKTL